MSTLVKMAGLSDSRGIVAQCDNCKQRWTEAQLLDMENIHARLDAGSEVPAGECPSCKSLCYLIRKKQRTRTVVLQDEDDIIQSVLILPAGMTPGKAREAVAKAWAEVKEKYQGNWNYDVLVKKLVNLGWVAAERIEWQEG